MDRCQDGRTSENGHEGSPTFREHRMANDSSMTVSGAVRHAFCLARDICAIRLAVANKHRGDPFPDHGGTVCDFRPNATSTFGRVTKFLIPPILPPAWQVLPSHCCLPAVPGVIPAKPSPRLKGTAGSRHRNHSVEREARNETVRSRQQDSSHEKRENVRSLFV